MDLFPLLVSLLPRPLIRILPGEETEGTEAHYSKWTLWALAAAGSITVIVCACSCVCVCECTCVVPKKKKEVMEMTDPPVHT